VKVPVVGSSRVIADRIGAIARLGYSRQYLLLAESISLSIPIRMRAQFVLDILPVFSIPFQHIAAV
jgi:hypothetical protein